MSLLVLVDRNRHEGHTLGSRRGVNPSVSRMQSCEVKWIIHLALKDLRTVAVPEVALQRFHSLLADRLKVCNTLPAALGSRSEGRICGMSVSLDTEHKVVKKVPVRHKLTKEDANTYLGSVVY